MPKLGKATRRIAYWNNQPVGYYFDRSAQSVLNGLQTQNGKVVATHGNIHYVSPSCGACGGSCSSCGGCSS